METHMIQIRSALVPIGFLVVILAAGDTSGTRAQEGEPREPEAQWEYLIVSLGSVAFSSPFMELGAPGKSKISAMDSLPFPELVQALATQSAMDNIGENGWELVSVVGSIGGDQEFVFKREYDKARSEAEAERFASRSEERRVGKGSSDGGV